MTEFQWRNEMRKLGDPVEPVRDLWPAIHARVAAAPARRRARGPARLALAAAVLVAIGAAAFAWRMPALHAKKAASDDTTLTAAAEPPRAAFEWARSGHPAIAAASQDLDDASAQLQQALEQRPDAVFLVGLLNRTNGQRMRLLRQSGSAG